MHGGRWAAGAREVGPLAAGRWPHANTTPVHRGTVIRETVHPCYCVSMGAGSVHCRRLVERLVHGASLDRLQTCARDRGLLIERP